MTVGGPNFLGNGGRSSWSGNVHIGEIVMPRYRSSRKSDSRYIGESITERRGEDPMHVTVSIPYRLLDKSTKGRDLINRNSNRVLADDLRQSLILFLPSLCVLQQMALDVPVVQI